MNAASPPNLDVFDFETALEGAWAAALVDGGFLPRPAAAPKQQDADVVTTPFAAGKCVTAAADPVHQIIVGGVRYATVWRGVFYLRIVSERKAELRAGSLQHRRIVAAARWLGQQAKTKLQPYLKLHTLTLLHEIGTNPGIEAERGFDVSGLSFEFVINIKPGALG